jgi:hypothetical protein
VTTIVLTHIPDATEQIGERLSRWGVAMARDLSCAWSYLRTHPHPRITLSADEDAVREVAALYLDGIGVLWEIAGEVAA